MPTDRGQPAACFLAIKPCSPQCCFAGRSVVWKQEGEKGLSVIGSKWGRGRASPVIQPLPRTGCSCGKGAVCASPVGMPAAEMKCSSLIFSGFLCPSR